ncbi:RUS1 family protein homolog [Aspergillus lentulus]|uniref:RUS1 family protein n=1 Tax=Aspergillus lentulus TaxID=293939 RepID=UPI0013942781|nr:RUS1 family protein homolog [Aspergillus lentulus]GFF27841.1 RUS1 family protein homolog [Aspergillus lentulus]
MAISHTRNTIAFTEVDETNNPTATYVYSETQEHPNNPHEKSLSKRGRVDVMDSLQAFCSSIAGLLSSRAVLQGVGVGNADASPTSALLLHILQDSSGRIATILFAHRVGTALEPECKMYRLAADVFNDVAMVLDCLSPLIPAGVGRVGVLSAAGVLRALCGVAGGSSKASLSAHFARGGNLAEVNAKDSSQETIISLIGMLVGSFVVSHVTSFAATWASLLFLLTVHLGMNYAAVRAVQMTSLNRQRANIVFSTLLDSDPALDLHSLSLSKEVDHPPAPSAQQSSLSTSKSPLTPADVSKQERIFEPDGILKWTSASTQCHKLGYCQIGISLDRFLRLSSTSTSSSSSSSTSTKIRTSPSLRTTVPMPELSSLFAKEDYLLYLVRRGTRGPVWYTSLVLKNTCSVRSQLKAWTHALLAARVLYLSSSEDGDRQIFDVVARTLDFLNRDARFERYLQSLEEAGWDLTIAALETSSRRRIVVDDHQ